MNTEKEALTHLLWPSSSRPGSQGKTAIIQTGADKDRVVTYEELEGLINCAQQKLAGSGVGKLSRVVMSAPNCPELAAALLACFRLGAIAIPVDFRITVSEFENIARHLAAKVVLKASKYSPDFEKELSALKDAQTELLDLSSLTPLSCSGDKEGASTQTSAEGSSNTASIEKMDLSEPAMMILTSGTTGMPKGAVHDLGSLATNMIELGEMAKVDADTRGVLPLPLSHIFGLEVFSIIISYGGTIVLSEPSPQSFFASVRNYAPQILVGVPTMYGAMLTLPKEAMNLEKARILLSGGAPLPISLAEDFIARFGKRINNGYGSTETKIFALNLDGPHESVGTIVPSVKVEIVNENDEVLPEGETGEIRVESKILMQGYLGQPDLTAKVLRNGRYYTGDMGRLVNGYLYISGRAKEMIIVAGNKVFPSEVEDVLRKHPLVKEVAVVGPPHKQLGQTVKAIIVTPEGEYSDKLNASGDQAKVARQEMIAQLREFCKQNLKRELRPMEWDFQPASQPLPKTSSGKIDKKQLVAV